MRLIDADALAARLENECREWEGESAYQAGLCAAAVIVAEAPTVGGWINVKDRLPDGECLAFSEKYKEMIIGHLYKDNVSKSHWSAENEEVVLYDVTHWMPLPTPPGGET